MMNQSAVAATVAMGLAALLMMGCGSETTGSGDAGNVRVNLVIGNTDVTAVSFEVVCDSGITLNGQFNVNDEQDPPIWAAVMDLLPGNCTITLIALDDAGAPLCTGSTDFTVEANETTSVEVVLECGGGGGDEPLGDVNVTAIFVEGNTCPRLHFLNAVPNNVPPEGSEVTVLVSDKDGDVLTTELTATGGSFADPSAQSTLYTCDGAKGAQTITVTVTDGDPTCGLKSKSFPVTCVECNSDAECDPGEFCVGNVCQEEAPFCEYVQDFEALDPADPDALANDGWLYFGSVFDGDGEFKFQFGPFPATTTSGQVSAIVSGEGGPGQGEQQLVVFSNYDCCDIPNQGHFNGTDVVNTTVFQSDSIVAADIGRTFTLQFDAKRGNIEGASTAQAFIRTLDPDADFALTSSVVLDVTDLPVDWGTYSIALTLSDPDLEGQLLQFGFRNSASNFEGSGIFYDNIDFGPQDCVGECAVDSDCPDDGSECTADVCNAGRCESVDVPDGTACNNDTGTCDAGVCRPSGPIVCEYEQDFEALDPANPDALGSDQWLYFGGVFDGTGVFKFGFGPFPAPTTSGQISAIATGEGGPDQGNNQLVVFSNYDCCTEAGPEGHFNGTDLVDTLVFQEINPILATDIGRTFTFTFDAKRGNIGGNTTAEAYILTLDPDADFAITNRVALDTTNLPVDWGTYSITFDASDPALEGQILQFGFITTASNFDPAGNFYDNISFCAPGGGGGGPGIERRPLPEIYFTGNAINYSPYRAQGPEVQPPERPSDEDVLEDLRLLQTAGYNLLRLFGGDPVSEQILRLAEENFPEMRFQQGLFLEGLAPGPAQENCDSQLNDEQVATAIRLANTYSNVVTVSVGNETSFFSAFMPLNCLEGYIRETRNNVTQPVTADDDYTFYANFFGRAPDGVIREIDFVAIHMYPITNYRFWDWQQLGVPPGPQRAEAMMNESLAVAQSNYQAVYDYRYRDATGKTVTIGETLPIVVGETGWKWRQTNFSQEIETYAGNPVNAKWYGDLMRGWERTPGGPPTIFIFVAFDEAWKGTDDGWGFWDELRNPNYALCGTPAGTACNDPLYEGAGFFFQ
jgi:exo-beta-1,3-glucanase (GH17 family)